MKRSFGARLLALCLALCLLPAAAPAETNDGTPVTRSDFSLALRLNAGGFPADGAAHYQDWESFLSKIRLAGVADVQSFLSPFSRVYFDGGLYLNDRLTVPFEYDGYYSFRYLRSPALGGASVHFQMFNFFQFMLKGYYYMGLPTQLLALPLYPEAATGLFEQYAGPIRETFAGEGSRTVSHAELYELCETLNLIVNEDQNDAAYYFFTCLLIDLGMSDMLLLRLGSLEEVLEFLDPDGEGMTITVADGRETWRLGETVVLERTAADGRTELNVSVPDPEGYEYRFSAADSGTERRMQAAVLQEEEEQICLTADIGGLGDPLRAEGEASVSLTGSALWQESSPQRFAYRYARTAQDTPCQVTLDVDWLHPQTGLPAVGFSWEAALETMPPTVLRDRIYDNQDDFFHLNESFLAEYKERFLPTLALAFTPFVLEMPAGIFSDTVGFLEETGLLAFLGIE